MEFVRIDYKNDKLTNASLNGHREIITEYDEKGYDYVGFVPVKMGASGKTLAIDLVFKKR